MPYILKGTKNLVSYWNTLGRPCELMDLAAAVNMGVIHFQGAGRDSVSESVSYGEVQAQNLAKALGVTVANVTTNGGQIQI